MKIPLKGLTSKRYAESLVRPSTPTAPSCQRDRPASPSRESDQTTPLLGGGQGATPYRDLHAEHQPQRHRRQGHRHLAEQRDGRLLSQKPGVANAGLVGGDANAVAAKKRPYVP